MRPLPLHEAFGNTKIIRDFLHGQSAKEPQLHDLSLPGVKSRKALQGQMKFGYVHGPRLGSDQVVMNGNRPHAPAALEPLLRAGMVYEDPSHHRGANGKKVRAPLPIHPQLAHEPQVGFVDKGRRLQGMAGSLTRKVSTRYLTHFVVNERQEAPRNFGGRHGFGVRQNPGNLL